MTLGTTEPRKRRFEMTYRKRLTAMAVVAMAALGGACNDEDRSLLPTAASIEAPALPAALGAGGTNARAAIEDALTRLVPSLSDPGEAEPLRTTLSVLHSHLEAGNGEAARGAVVAVETALARYERLGGLESADAPDLDALRLALEGVTR
jgi:hypothetical protein